jgi:alpha-amylase
MAEVGFDGFRFDMVKGYGGWMVRAILEQRVRGGTLKPFGVGECWDSDYAVDAWLDETNAFSDNPASAFDFALRYRLRDLCEQYGFDLATLAWGGTLSHDRPFTAVTFVENHDVERGDPIVHAKMLAYAYVLTHEGYPCVFWRDYFEYGLARAGNPDGIQALVEAHERYAGGGTDVLCAEHDIYIMQRRGSGAQPGLVFVLNNRGDWAGRWVCTRWANQSLVPVAYSCADTPYTKRTQDNGWVDLWAPPRGYVVYAVK